MGIVPLGWKVRLPWQQWPAPTAAARSGNKTFDSSSLPEAFFDGVFANASMFHIPKSMLPSVLEQLRATLKPRGVLFSSNPRGNNEESIQGGRYGAYYDLSTWRAYLTAAGFSEIEHYYRPAGLPVEQQPWLASVWRRNSG